MKQRETEELLDLWIYRPLGFLPVLLLYRTPVTANHLTVFTMFIGAFCGYFFALGTTSAFIAGGVLLFAVNALDCSDGQLARAKQQSSQMGRMLDGLGDGVIDVTSHAGLAYAAYGATGDWRIWLLAALSLASLGFHTALLDAYRHRYTATSGGASRDATQEQMNPAGKAGLCFRAYRVYCVVQSAISGMVNAWPVDARAKRSIRLVSFLGSTTHRTVIILCALACKPMWVFWIFLVGGNAYLIVCLWCNRSTRQQVSRTRGNE
jgi:phosphatidylglycerophosphate synthase